MDYSKSLNLPKTDFPMRANLPQREPEILQFWDEIDVYRKVQAKNDGRPKYVLHDGPPYANGHIHLGTTLNKVLKDIIVKFHAMDGQDAPYVPGWDTHGLPIEQQAIKTFKIRRDQVSPIEFRQKCKEFALKFVDIQREEFKRLGVRGDWTNPYLTLYPHFEKRQIEVFGEMAKHGYIYKGLKSVYWCSTCETALAEAEVEYVQKESPSIYVTFRVVEGKGLLPEDGETFVVIWTTTPWTLPANVAICLHPDFQYVLLRSGGRSYLVARELADSFRNVLGDPTAEVTREFEGRELEGLICAHPFIDRRSVVVLGDYVTLDQGTGCVHIAPGHGEEDFALGQKYDLPVLSPINSKGYFTAEAGDLEGTFYLEGNKRVLEKLEEAGALLQLSPLQHQYPHCWRCKKSIFFRATEQWFASIDGFRKDLLEAIDRVRWIPGWGRERIHGMVANRGDWCISRQRLWGVPIPIFYCGSCEEVVIDDQTIEHLKILFGEYGSDIWFARDAADLLPPDYRCPYCGHGEFTKETDIMDVWFDSGCSHWGVLTQPDYWPDLRWPADLYLEGSDQHRGWFNSSLTTSVSVTGEPPYRAVLTHGFVVDEQGRKMSKSLGNVVDPGAVIKDLGADILRLWVCSADYKGDLAVSPSILKQMSEAYRKIRNTFRFLLGNLYDFDPAKHQVEYDQLLEIDKFGMLKLHKLIDRVVKAYRSYEFHTVYHAVYNYCVTDLSAFYINVLKDRLYCEGADSVERRAAQTVLYANLDALVRLLVPVLAFTTEEIWRYVPVVGEKAASVQLCDVPEANPEYLDGELEQRWERLLAVRDEVQRVLEGARQSKLIRDSLQAEVVLYADNELARFLLETFEHLALIFVSSAVSIKPLAEAPETAAQAMELDGLKIEVRPAQGQKCARCWIYTDQVGTHPDRPEVCSRCAGVTETMAVG
ncbi:MAG: isoleucine--tRNA ligase [Desulforudis sp.]|nr:MAG: isoleucine--tRNA ligase [Desulforudis sp.]